MSLWWITHCVNYFAILYCIVVWRIVRHILVALCYKEDASELYLMNNYNIINHRSPSHHKLISPYFRDVGTMCRELFPFCQRIRKSSYQDLPDLYQIDPEPDSTMHQQPSFSSIQSKPQNFSHTSKKYILHYLTISNGVSIYLLKAHRSQPQPHDLIHPQPQSSPIKAGFLPSSAT